MQTLSRDHGHRPGNGEGDVDADVGHDGELIGDGGAAHPQVAPKQRRDGASARHRHRHLEKHWAPRMKEECMLQRGAQRSLQVAAVQPTSHAAPPTCTEE